MAELFPFRGYRFDLAKVGDIADVVTQPYDKISSEMRQQYLERHPENVVRIIKNPDYQDAADRFNHWIETGILRSDQEASFYPYEQVFEYEGATLSRIGFIGLVALDDENLAVKGHEKVLKKPLEDRLNLIRANEANDGLIFTLYSDPEMRAEKVLVEFTSQNKPEYELQDEFGVYHRVWQLSTSDSINLLIQTLRGKPLYIADGHHRFQTAVLYRRECLEKGWKATASESFDKRMVALFNMESPMVKILATHRAVRNLPDFNGENLVSQLIRFFQVQQCKDMIELSGRLDEAEHQIGLLSSTPAGFYLLRLKAEALADAEFMPNVAGIARELDVNILHEGILSPLLGIGAEELAGQLNVDYLRDRSELAAGVRNGKYQAGFLLNPTTVEEVRAISELGEKMPQKSTDFYPKLLTGLVFMKMIIER
jgi:uncharacterized protein (DUF1015 family)